MCLRRLRRQLVVSSDSIILFGFLFLDLLFVAFLLQSFLFEGRRFFLGFFLLCLGRLLRCLGRRGFFLGCRRRILVCVLVVSRL